MTAKKHVVIASDSMYPRTDGIARFLVEIIPRLVDSYDVSVLAPSFGEDKKNVKDVAYVYFPLSLMRFGDFRLSRINPKQIRYMVERADIVWVHTYGPIGACAARAAKDFKKPLVISNHVIEWDLYVQSIGLPRFLQSIGRWMVKKWAIAFYNKADVVFASSFELKHLIKDHGVKTRVEVVHLGVDSTTFSPPSNKQKLKKQLGYKEKTILIAYSGRIAREKNVQTLVDAFKKIRKQYSNVRLLLIGDGPKHLKRDLQGQDIVITGFVTDIASYLKACDIFVMPSLTETTSLATLEAMAVGLPVVSTRVGYIQEYLTHGLNGFFFEKEDVLDLFKKINILLSFPAKRKKFGLNGRQIVKNHLTWKNTATSVKKIFKELL